MPGNAAVIIARLAKGMLRRFPNKTSIDLAVGDFEDPKTAVHGVHP